MKISRHPRFINRRSLLLEDLYDLRKKVQLSLSLILSFHLIDGSVLLCRYEVDLVKRSINLFFFLDSPDIARGPTAVFNWSPDRLECIFSVDKANQCALRFLSLLTRHLV